MGAEAESNINSIELNLVCETFSLINKKTFVEGKGGEVTFNYTCFQNVGNVSFAIFSPYKSLILLNFPLN